MNQLQRVFADALMLLLLFGILIIPISSVNLLKYENSGESETEGSGNEPLMQVLSKQDVRGDAVEATESSQATESTPSTIKSQ